MYLTLVLENSVPDLHPKNGNVSELLVGKIAAIFTILNKMLIVKFLRE
jgi:hypothetical protein